MVTLTQLLDHLDIHIRNAQKSERWAMYRLIAPVVDFANQALGWRDYFEFNQTSRHGTSQSVDVTLLDALGMPRVMIEAKRVGRGVSAELIDKYLEPGIRGIVSDGVLWVMCLDGRSETLAIFDERMRAIKPAVEKVVAFMQGAENPNADWGTTDKEYHRSSIRPTRLSKTVIARRAMHEIVEARSASEFEAATSKLETASRLDQLFLQAMAEEFNVAWRLPQHLHAEFRSTRISFFDARLSGRSNRVARLELGKQQPDVLILTVLAAPITELLKDIPVMPHDKGPHMRRFRLGNDTHAQQLGVELAKILMQ